MSNLANKLHIIFLCTVHLAATKKKGRNAKEDLLQKVPMIASYLA